ncbi:MAG TPA: hypothetical protein DCF33_00840 [Saprospirales bacterium]|nr:hypothetical protein [Saprospirales bacterium]
MNFFHIFIACASLSATFLPEGKGQQTTPPGTDTTVVGSENAPAPPTDSVQKAPAPTGKLVAKHKFLNLGVTGGQLTIPFKIRRKEENQTFRLTTDVTLGAYIGLTQKLSTERNYHLTVPVTAGLTFVNINNNNTSLEFSAGDGGETEVVPGLTWSTGIILQLEEYNFGFILGKDYAGEVGDQWIYHRQWWWSFGLGFSFTN